jgi:O-acetylserine/cysteine efflux transporter
MIMVKKYAKEIDTKNMLAWIHLLNIPLFLVLTLIFDDLSLDFLKGKSLTDWIGGLYSGVVSTAIGFGIWFSLLKKYSINKVSPFMLFVPFFGILLSVLFFDSKLTTSFLFGGTLIIIGLMIIQFLPYFKSKK